MSSDSDTGTDGSEYESDGAQPQDPGDWPETEREAAEDALPDDAAEEGDQTDAEVQHLGGPEESGPPAR